MTATGPLSTPPGEDGDDALRGTRIKFRHIHHIGDVDRAFALDDRPLRMLLALARVAFDHGHAFDNHAALFGQQRNHAAPLAFVRTGQHHDLVVFLNVKALHNFKSLRVPAR